jgi:hypothetical protein
MMNSTSYKTDRLPGSELRRMVEPLANYICATDQPRKALALALSALFSEVAATNRVAISHFHSYSEN